MEKKITALYILSISAILAFMGMQVYWLYSRLEYSLREYEHAALQSVELALLDYNKARNKSYVSEVQSHYSISHPNDSTGMEKRKVKVATTTINGRALLGIEEDRTLTPEEMEKLAKLVMDSIEHFENKRVEVDASSAPSDGAAWVAMENFELEAKAPFTAKGIDSMLRKENVSAKATLCVYDTLVWGSSILRHASPFRQSLKIAVPYSELENKVAEIEVTVPAAQVLRGMGWTLAMAFVLSAFLIACLVWQIKTITRLARIDKMRSSFVTTMIHELKRPISTLKMCVSGIDSCKLMQDEKMRRELTAEMRKALDNLSAYFSKLRDIAFNNVEQIPLNVSSFNLRALVEDVANSVAIPGAKSVEIGNGVPEGIDLSADRAHMMNILTNLIENAIKYSGDEVCVKISAERDSTGDIICVADNGNGISKADLPKIFDRFYRGNTKNADVPGIGLGLAYVRLLVDAHSGKIWVESDLGKGSTFFIKLPQ